MQPLGLKCKGCLLTLKSQEPLKRRIQQDLTHLLFRTERCAETIYCSYLKCLLPSTQLILYFQLQSFAK
jgi:hypothetical protein